MIFNYNKQRQEEYTDFNIWIEEITDEVASMLGKGYPTTISYGSEQDCITVECERYDACGDCDLFYFHVDFEELEKGAPDSAKVVDIVVDRIKVQEIAKKEIARMEHEVRLIQKREQEYKKYLELKEKYE